MKPSSFLVMASQQAHCSPQVWGPPPVPNTVYYGPLPEHSAPSQPFYPNPGYRTSSSDSSSLIALPHGSPSRRRPRRHHAPTLPICAHCRYPSTQLDFFNEVSRTVSHGSIEQQRGRRIDEAGSTKTSESFCFCHGSNGENAPNADIADFATG